MIREPTPDDVPSVIDLVIAANLFTADESQIVDELFAGYFRGANGDGHVSLVDDDDGILAAAYCQPIEAADRVWDLTMIAVLPSQQRSGRGSHLLACLETTLRNADQRLLLVETSGTPEYESARAFYRRCGYDREARVRDYWTTGDDMILFRKDLSRSV